MLIFSSSPRVLGSIAYEITGSANLIGSTVNARALSPSRSLVSVSFSFATAPRSPDRISGTFVGVFPCSSVRWPSRSGDSRVMFWIVESAFTVPEMTRNIVMRPANGSATVFQTKTAAGDVSEAFTATPSSDPLAVAVNGRSAGEGT